MRARVPDPLQLQVNVLRGLPTLIRVLGKADLHDSLEGRRRHGLQRSDRGWFKRKDGCDQACFRLSRKCRLSGRHFIEHGSQGENVGTDVGLFAFQLLRGHILKRSQQRPFSGELSHFRRHLCESISPGLLLELGQAEVKQLRARLREHDIARLQVAMNDPLAVGLSSASEIWMAY